jgi:adenylate cyclase class 2
MPHEIEINVVDIDLEEAIKRLQELGLKHVGDYDYKILNIEVKNEGFVGEANYYTCWARVRSDGNRTTLTLKEQYGTDINKRIEYEVETSDFVTTAKIIIKMLPDAKYNYIEKSRIHYLSEENNINVVIDKWPKLPYKMEIEGPSEEEIKKFYKKLNLKSGKLMPNIAVSDEDFYKMFNIDYKEIMKEYNEKFKRMLDESQ